MSAMVDMERFPRYRVITGVDDATFCYRISEALEMGYVLHSGPSLAIKDGQGYVAQALTWAGQEEPPLRPVGGM